jgi:hypothetical protein
MSRGDTRVRTKLTVAELSFSSVSFLRNVNRYPALVGVDEMKTRTST